MSQEHIIRHAESAVREGRLADAAAALEQVASANPPSARLALSHASSLYALRRIAEAEEVLAKAVQRWPLERSLQEALANTRWMLGQGDLFARDFEAAVDARPESVEMRVACANILCRADFRQRAEQLLRDGLRRNPDDLSYLLSLGALLDETDRTEEGLALLQKVYARAPDAPSLNENLTQALLRLARPKQALQFISAARRDNPHDSEWIAYETMALRQLGDPRYHELCDYDRMVQAYDLPAPSGYDSALAFNDALAAKLRGLHALADHPLGQSLRGGSQTTRSLLRTDEPEVRAYLKALEEPIEAYLELMSAADHPWSGRKTGRFRLSGCWSILLRAGGFHVNHVHPAGWISSAYYVQLPRAVDESSSQQGWIKFGEPRWPTPGCTVEKVVQPKVGRLVLFPSYMWHGTVPFDEGERLTAPFDVVPA